MRKISQKLSFSRSIWFTVFLSLQRDMYGTQMNRVSNENVGVIFRKLWRTESSFSRDKGEESLYRQRIIPNPSFESFDFSLLLLLNWPARHCVFSVNHWFDINIHPFLPTANNVRCHKNRQENVHRHSFSYFFYKVYYKEIGDLYSLQTL